MNTYQFTKYLKGRCIEATSFKAEDLRVAQKSIGKLLVDNYSVIWDTCGYGWIRGHYDHPMGCQVQVVISEGGV